MTREGRALDDARALGRFRFGVAPGRPRELRARLDPVFASLAGRDEGLHVRLLDAREGPTRSPRSGG